MSITMTKAHANLAISALMPKCQALCDMLHLQIQTLPADCDDWIHTQRKLKEYQEVIAALEEVGR